MIDLAERITSELQVLVGLPIVNCWRAADMAAFGFGERNSITNRKGELVEVSEIGLHLQCRWRLADAHQIIFGCDDLYRPPDGSLPDTEFDWNQADSRLDVLRRSWLAKIRDHEPKVTSCRGDAYSGFRIQLENGLMLESFPCDTFRGEYSEQWRLIVGRSNGRHFVVCGYGIEGEDDDASNSNHAV